MNLIKQIAITVLTFAILLNVPIHFFSVNYWLPSDNLGTTLTSLTASDNLSDFPTTYNANLTAINNGKIEVSTTTLPLLTTLANLTTIGTIGTGVWQGTTVDELYGGTGFSTYTAGDLLYSSATNVLSKLGVGSNGEVLTVSAGLPAWSSVSVNESLDYAWTGYHTFTDAFFTNASSTNATTTNLWATGSVDFTAATSITGVAQVASTSVWTADGTWTKPTGAKSVFLQGWGGGGSGGNNQSSQGACGGGGGAYFESWVNADDLASTVAVTVGEGGAGVVNSTASGNAGENTTFGSHFTAPGGGGGGTGDGCGASSGGNLNGAVTGLWGQDTSNAKGGSGLYSAAGGDENTSPNQGYDGGDSTYGGAGGAGVRAATASGGTSTYGGNGGASANGSNGTAGSAPSGGGGACLGGSCTSGAGGLGKLIITTFF